MAKTGGNLRINAGVFKSFLAQHGSLLNIYENNIPGGGFSFELVSCNGTKQQPQIINIHAKCVLGKVKRAKGKEVALKVTLDQEKDAVESVECAACNNEVCLHLIGFFKWLVQSYKVVIPPEVPVSVSTAKRGCEPKSRVRENPEKVLKQKTNQQRAQPETVEVVDSNSDEEMPVAKGKPTRLIALNSTTSAALTMAELMRTFTGPTDTKEEFVEHCRSKMAIERCDEAQLLTVEQAETELWHQLRIGRITASRIHQASRCKMSRGSLYESIMGFSRGGFSFAMDRGTALEDSVFDVVRSEYPGLQKSGLLLNSQYPFFGASPDGIHDEFVLEIKCPLNRNTHFDYVTPGKLKKQYVGQIHMQMMMAGKRKALLAVADPSFERNKKITKVWINYDEVYTTKLMEDAGHFWVQAIFTALKRHQPKKAK